MRLAWLSRRPCPVLGLLLLLSVLRVTVSVLVLLLVLLLVWLLLVLLLLLRVLLRVLLLLLLLVLMLLLCWTWIASSPLRLGLMCVPGCRFVKLWSHMIQCSPSCRAQRPKVHSRSMG